MTSHQQTAQPHDQPSQYQLYLQKFESQEQKASVKRGEARYPAREVRAEHPAAHNPKDSFLSVSNRSSHYRLVPETQKV